MTMRRRDPLTADPREKPACPECEHYRIFRRTRTAPVVGKWYCEYCDARFDDPIYDVPEHGNGPERPHISAAGQAALDWDGEEE